MLIEVLQVQEVPARELAAFRRRNTVGFDLNPVLQVSSGCEIIRWNSEAYSEYVARINHSFPILLYHF